MTIKKTGGSTVEYRPRLWPGVVAVALQWLVWFVVPLAVPGSMFVAVGGGVLGALAVVVWWVCFSRAPWADRLGAVLLMVAALAATSRFVHVSVATAGTGLLFPVYAIPVLSLAFVAWAVATRRVSELPRRLSMVAVILLACGAWTLLRTEGVTGEYRSLFHWRWTQSPEERLLERTRDEPAERAATPSAVAAPQEAPSAEAGREPAAPPPARVAEKGPPPAEAETGAGWPGFRGPERNGIVLTSAGEGDGLRRLTIARGAGGWTVDERWRSTKLKAYFNDFVVHGNHAFGFDGGILACVDLADGTRVWKGGRYGRGQLVLLPAQNALLVVSEEGELVLVRATPEQFTELARFPAIQGKTWNHPVLAGDVVLVRNGEEMAAFRLAAGNR